MNILVKELIQPLLEEMSQADLKSIEIYAEKELSPNDVDFSKHFFDRLNDPRNIKPISPIELVVFFKRLASKKEELNSFLEKYKEVVASDNKTNINIPLVKMADKIIAKTIMRKKNFQTSDPKIELDENYGCQQPNNFKQALISLTKYMLDQGLNISPLPKLKIINSDSKNAENILGKTAYYDPNSCSITLYTLNRHPKDVLRSYSHEMIHRIQDNEGRLNNVNTTNTNEDSNLQELEKEAYLNGNIIFRNWEDSIKNSKLVNEIYFLDIPKFNQPKTFVDKLCESLHEIVLSKNNAVEMLGNLTDGQFTVGDQTYIYKIKEFPIPPYYDPGLFYNIEFHPKGNPISEPQGGKENYVKILSTMYKVILDFVEQEKPEYIGIASLDNEGSKNYHTIYANLTDNKFNRIPGYFRKDVGLRFDGPRGKGKMVVLKRKNEI